MQSKAAPDIDTLKEITKSMNPDTVKDLIDAAGISKVGQIIFTSCSFWGKKLSIVGWRPPHLRKPGSASICGRINIIKHMRDILIDFLLSVLHNSLKQYI